MNTPTMQSVKSSQISEIGFDAETATLFIRFKPGKGATAGPLYSYAGFPAAGWEAFKSAESFGRYFGANIKGKYPHEKL